SYIPELVEHHYEELQFLWGQRESALRSPKYTMRELSALEQRIDAHVQGLLVAGVDLIHIVEQGLTSDDAATSFAAAYALLRLENETATLAVIQAFSGAQGKQMYGLRQALSLARMEQLLPSLPFLFFSSATPTVAAAADVLACHGALPPPGLTIDTLLQDEDPGVRETAWRVVANSGLSVDPKLYAAAMRDEAPAVRRAGLVAAAWTSVPGALLLARQLAETPTLDNLYALELLAILGETEDVQRVIALAKVKELGPARFKLVGAFGHPALIELVLAELTNSDPEAAVAAAAAFTKMTGLDIESKERTALPPKSGEQSDEFEAEFAEEVTLPNPELARAHWDKVKPQFVRTTRLCRGMDISRGAPPEALAKLDMESRWELFLRSKFNRTWAGAPADLERFPQPQS
ncbi:MAG TPA: hypothetical protein VFX42_11615, partial [Gemmatimonadales bacterium]|nr:hypothetical protein [Gemmatimonadales bacterium]